MTSSDLYDYCILYFFLFFRQPACYVLTCSGSLPQIYKLLDDYCCNCSVGNKVLSLVNGHLTLNSVFFSSRSKFAYLLICEGHYLF